MMGKLILEDGTELEGKSFGATLSAAGEAVFSTGMVGYPESLTDPSYLGQILILTYPIIGSYGVSSKEYWESDGIKISGLVVSNYINTPSHFQSKKTLSQWLKEFNVPALEISDTRFLAKKIRDRGAMLAKIICGKDVPFYDPNNDNLVAQVSTKKILASKVASKGLALQGEALQNKTIVLIDCGAKGSIEKCLLERGVKVITVPWDYNIFSKEFEQYGKFGGILVSNGPGDPKKADITIETVKKAVKKKIPILGICLGNQILALAAGGDTYKLKFGHRSQNQPCILHNSKLNRCYITTQNHGFAVKKIPKGFSPWFVNANDGTNEGIIHQTLPFMSIQFHPEACPGPLDTEWIFDYFLKTVNSENNS